MTDSDVNFGKLCRFCGQEKDIGKFIFSFEAAKINLLRKIKNLFPEESDLINPKSILPKFICTSCETSIHCLDEFRSSLKLVQQTLLKKIPSRINNKLNLDEVQHVCTVADQNSFIVRCYKDGSVCCNACSIKLHFNQIPIADRSCSCICFTCGYKDKMQTFLGKNTNIICPKCSNNETNEISPSTSNALVKKFECDICKKCYRSKSHLNRHCVTHSGTKPFACQECGSSFWQKTTLKTHSLIHKKLNPFSCEWCGQAFRHKQTFTSHVTSVHGVVSSIASLFECNKCKKKFGRKEKLQRHYRSHSGEKPFKCDICSRMFSQRINLKTHYKKHETDTEFSTVPQVTINVNQTTTQGDIIQELLNFDITPETDVLQTFSIVENQYSEDSIPIKPSDTTNDMYFNNTPSSCMIYSSNSIIYDLDDPTETSALPNFSRLNSTSVKAELTL